MIVLLKERKIFFYKNYMFLTAKTGLMPLSIINIKTTIQIIVEKNQVKFLLFEKTPYSIRNLFVQKVKETLKTFDTTHKKKISIIGVGFKCWLYKWLVNRSNLILKIGFSRDLMIQLPTSIKAVALKPTLILLKSFNKVELGHFVCFLYSLKTTDIYKGKGLQYMNQKISLKPGKHK